MKSAVDNLVGNEPVRTAFTTVYNSARRGHAFLLYGPSQVGKRAFVDHLLRTQMNGSIGSLAQHPDVVSVRRDPESATISVETVRALQHRINVRPIYAQEYSVVIDDVDTMTESAANALLKLLEEPPAPTTFFLIATYRDSVPRTIQSRCVPIAFSLVPIPQLTDWLKALGETPQAAHTISYLSEQRPGRAWQLLQERQAMQEQHALQESSVRLVTAPMAERLSLLHSLLGPKPDREYVSLLIHQIRIVVRAALLNTGGTTVASSPTLHQSIIRLPTRIPRRQWVELYRRIHTAEKLRTTALNAQLLLEYIVLPTS